MSDRPSTEEQVSEKNSGPSQLKLLIAKGKSQGYITYADVHDNLPSHIVEPEEVEEFIHMIEDMGVKVHETAPDADQLLLSEEAADSEDDDNAALAAIDESDLNYRTTDPVRMYMREMGTVELLTREGEIAIAKRIEEGMKQVTTSLAHQPLVVEQLLLQYALFQEEEAKLNDIITGFTSDELADYSENPEDIPDREDDSDDDTEIEDTGPDPERAAEYFTELEKAYQKAVQAEKRYGKEHKSTKKKRDEMAEAFLQFRITPKQTSRLIAQMRGMLEEVRKQERSIMRLCIKNAKLPRKTFVTTFPDNETDLTWIDSLIKNAEIN